MGIVYSEPYRSSLYKIWDFIAEDSLVRADEFLKKLTTQIEDIPNMPFMYRQSAYFDDNSIRDMIYKGYTVVFYINEEEETIMILGITKYREKL